jgi:tetratricopeptide (TPR) repeat protein
MKFAGARPFLAAVVCFLLLGGADELSGQNLPLKRGVPGTDSIACPEIAPPGQPSQEEIDQAVRLGSEADQDLIRGNLERARDLLLRATELDPTSPELAYRYGRRLEALEEWEGAITQFCRAQALGAEDAGIRDIPLRLEALARAREPELPEGARSAFLNGLLQADLGDLQGAVEGFDRASSLAPDWADAVYNRGVIRMRLGEQDLAVEDLQRYLNLSPDAADAILVSQRIGQLQVRPGPSVSPGTALGLGLIIPGMGQFYSGRALGGFSVLALAGGAVAAGLFIEKLEVRCVGSPPSGGDCPPDRIISEDTSKPYLVPSLVAAGVVTLVGAIEAFVNVGRSGPEEDEEMVAFDAGKTRIVGPSVAQVGNRLQLSLVRVTW